MPQIDPAIYYIDSENVENAIIEKDVVAVITATELVIKPYSYITFYLKSSVNISEIEWIYYDSDDLIPTPAIDRKKAAYFNLTGIII